MSRALNEKPNAEPLPSLASAGVTLNGRYLPPPDDKDGKIWVRTSALIQAGANDLYEMWRDIESAPLWQEQISQVTRTGDATSHWVMRASEDSDDKTIEWDSEILADEPGRRIAWRSIGDESDNAGEVIFEPAAEGPWSPFFKNFGSANWPAPGERLSAAIPNKRSLRICDISRLWQRPAKSRGFRASPMDPAALLRE